ncbi:MAG: hypothetical protein M0R77_21165, partial [Gammaproteobacteria bacterium]|nr:hypothetical protein [Gammaproteobacteria bacterium]
EFISEHAITTNHDLDLYEGSTIWLVLTTSGDGGKDWYATKVPWIHNGLFNYRGEKYGDTNNNRIIFCQNQENIQEYFLTQDFMPESALSNLNSIFPSEDLADTFINITILTRDNSQDTVSSILDNIIKERSFAHSGTEAYTLFDMISIVDEDLLKSIPLFQKDS